MDGRFLFRCSFRLAQMSSDAEIRNSNSRDDHCVCMWEARYHGNPTRLANTMNESEQIKAIAELDGFDKEPTKPRTAIWGLSHNKPEWNFIHQLPRYLESRDAIVPVIEKLTYIGKTQVVDFLCDLMLEGYDGSDYVKQSDVPLLLCASPAVICEALLRSTGRWK